MLRTKLLLQTIYALPFGQFSFTIFDEIFSGTSPQEAIIGSGSVIETLVQFPQSLNIIATHHRLLTVVENYTNGNFKNYKVSVIKKEDGTFTFPYLIEQGISNQHIALDILEQNQFAFPSPLNITQKLKDLILQHGTS